MSDEHERTAIVTKIQEMGQAKFARMLEKMTPEQRRWLADTLSSAPKAAQGLKETLAARVREDFRGMPNLAKTFIDCAQALGGLFDDEAEEKEE